MPKSKSKSTRSYQPGDRIKLNCGTSWGDWNGITGTIRGPVATMPHLNGLYVVDLDEPLPGHGAQIGTRFWVEDLEPAEEININVN